MSACTTIRKKIVLLVYDDLADAERAELEAHLKVCSECQQELAALRQMHSEIPRFTISDEILQPTRRALFYRLRSVAEPQSHASPWWSTGKLVLQAGLAVVLIFFGFRLGQQKVEAPVRPAFAVNDLLTATRVVSVEDGTISPHLVGVNKITINPIDGSVEISYNTMNDVHIQGGGNNPAVQQMLQFALLNENDPSLRLRAVKAVEQLSSTSMVLDEIYIDALGQILTEEQNIGTKLSIIKILGSARTPRAQEMLVQSMLTDDNEAVRIQAFKSLALDQENFADLAILSTTKMDTNTYIRIKSLEILNHKKGTSL